MLDRWASKCLAVWSYHLRLLPAGMKGAFGAGDLLGLVVLFAATYLSGAPRWVNLAVVVTYGGWRMLVANYEGIKARDAELEALRDKRDWQRIYDILAWHRARGVKLQSERPKDAKQFWLWYIRYLAWTDFVKGGLTAFFSTATLLRFAHIEAGVVKSFEAAYDDDHNLALNLLSKRLDILGDIIRWEIK